MNERRVVKGQSRHLAIVFVAALSIFGFGHFCYEVAHAEDVRAPIETETAPAVPSPRIHVCPLDPVVSAAQEHNPVACGREDDRDRAEDRVACECYHEHDPCDKDRPETRACSSFCNKKLCGCCQI